MSDGAGRHVSGDHRELGRRPRVALVVWIGLGALLAYLGNLLVAAGEGEDRSGSARADDCPVLRVVVASSYRPVLDELAAPLADAEECVDVQATTADGREADEAVEDRRAHVWISDDISWQGLAAEGVADEEEAGDPVTIATSPVVFVANAATTERLTRAGASWRGLAELIDSTRQVRIVSSSPAASSDGLLGIGGLGEARWESDGMDASAELLSRAYGRHVVRQDPLSVPLRDGDVAVVPERLLVLADQSAQVTTPTDETELLRYGFSTTAFGDDSSVAAARERLLAALTEGEEVSDALGTAGLRSPDGDWAGQAEPPGWVVDPLPEARPPLEPHRMQHVFATWFPSDRATDLLVVIDVSGSMAEPLDDGRPLIEVVKDQLERVERQLPDNARLGIWVFGASLDPPRDYIPTAALQPLDPQRRSVLRATIASITARDTGTGLYDTILDAYRHLNRTRRPGVQAHVLLLTDGRNQDDPGSIGPARLRAELQQEADSAEPVGLAVIQVGNTSDRLEPILASVDGRVVYTNTADGVEAAFTHSVAGGLTE